jgi:hypothetical protein
MGLWLQRADLEIGGICLPPAFAPWEDVWDQIAKVGTSLTVYGRPRDRRSDIRDTGMEPCAEPAPASLKDEKMVSGKLG